MKKVICPADVELIQGPGRVLWPLVSPHTSGTKEMTLLHVEFQPGASTDMHTHEGLEVMYVVRGQGRIVIDDISYAFSEGHVLITEAGEPHQVFNSDAGLLVMANSFVPALSLEFYERIREAGRQTK